MASHFSCLPDISSGSPCSRCKPRGAGLRGDGKSDSGIVTISSSFPTGEGENMSGFPWRFWRGWGYHGTYLEGEGVVISVGEQNIAGVNKGCGKVTITLKHET